MAEWKIFDNKLFWVENSVNLEEKLQKKIDSFVWTVW